MTAEKTPTRRCVELFAGLGGMAVGLSTAGFEHQLVVERDPAAVRTLRENLDTQHWPLFDRDVRELDYSTLSTGIDLLAAGVPCQPFSQGGAHAGPADDRNMFPETFAAIRALRPKAVLIENVRGLARPRFSEFLSYVLTHLRTPDLGVRAGEDWSEHLIRLRKAQRASGDLGARYVVQWAPVCVADYGVAQRRVRVIIVAIQEHLAHRWTWPQATHGSEELQLDKLEGRYWDEHGLTRPSSSLTSAAQSRLRQIPRPTERARWRTIRDVTADLGRPARTGEDPCLAGHVFWPGARLYRGHGGSFLDEASKTIKAGVHGVAGGEHIVHLDEGGYRYLSVRECMRIQDLPDHLVIDAPRSNAMRQIGNAVPPRLAEVFGAKIGQAVCDPEAMSRAEYARQQDLAAGGYLRRQIEVDGERMTAGVRFQNEYAYLYYSGRAGNPLYLGRVNTGGREEMLAEAWRIAHHRHAHLFLASTDDVVYAQAG